MKNYIEIRICAPDEELRYMMTQNLMLIDYEGVEEEGNFLIAYCEEDKYDEDTLKLMLNYPDTPFTKQIIPEQNWNALWESNFEPVIVDGFAAIRAAFHEPIKDVAHEIIITPKMSFGTGHHATTYMMMEQMKRIVMKDKTVFDFGTGTGILSILAKKMGALKIVAMDNDDWSIANAKENFGANECGEIILLKDDSVSIEEKFDIIVANINKNVILASLYHLFNILNKGGTLLLSGLLAEDEQDILTVSESFGLNHSYTQHRDKWISILLKA